MFQQKDSYSHILTEIYRNKRMMPWDKIDSDISDFYARFQEKPYCLIQRINTGFEKDDWDKTHGCVRGELVTRVLDVKSPELTFLARQGFDVNFDCTLRLEDPEGNPYDALQCCQRKKDYRTVKHIIRLNDSLVNKLEQSSYYPYAGVLRKTGSNSEWEVIKLTPLDNLQAMEAMERMKKYREESENLRKQDEEREAAIRRHQEEERLAEQSRQRAYDAKNAAVDQNELDRMFRSSGK